MINELTSWQRQKRKRHGQGNWKLIRYADDLVLMVSGDRRHAEELRQEVAAALASLTFSQRLSRDHPVLK